MEEIVCKRCGKCCHYKLEGKPTHIPCKYLIKHSNGVTSCRIYGNRLGKDIGHNSVCRLRETHHFNYKGCPYNQPGWPDIEEE